MSVTCTLKSSVHIFYAPQLSNTNFSAKKKCKYGILRGSELDWSGSAESLLAGFGANGINDLERKRWIFYRTHITFLTSVSDICLYGYVHYTYMNMDYNVHILQADTMKFLWGH